MAHSSIIKCSQRLVRDHINTTLSDTLDPPQCDYHTKRSSDGAIAMALHTASPHLNMSNIGVFYLRMRFVDYSSASNKKISLQARHHTKQPGSEQLPLQLPGFWTSWRADSRCWEQVSTPLPHWLGTPIVVCSVPSCNPVTPGVMHNSNSIIRFTLDPTMVGY